MFSHHNRCCYALTGSRTAIVVSIGHFDQLEERKTSKKDAKQLTKSLERLGFKCFVLTGWVLVEHVLDKIKEQLNGQQNHDMFMLVLCSHATPKDKEFIFSNGEKQQLGHFQKVF